MTEPIDQTSAEEIEFLEVVHGMQDTANIAADGLDKLLAMAIENEGNVSLSPRTTTAIISILRLLATTVTKLTEENYSQRDLAREALEKMEALAVEASDDRDDTTASG